MKTLNDYMAMNYRMEIIEDREEGGYVVSYPELPGCLTCGETIESAVANAIDAKKAWLEAALEEGIEIHEPDSLDEYSGQFKLRIPRSLQLGYKFGFIDDSETWLLMLKKRNTSVHIYNEEEVDELILLIRDSFIPAFTALKDTLVKKLDEAESNWE